MKTKSLKTPFPAFGGKAVVADVAWDRLGDPDNYVEPFAFSAAVLLRRPTIGRTETINDRNHFVVNFWRAVRSDPESVADYADNPVSEVDLHARHRYLTRGPESETFRQRMVEDPEYFDSKFAGWWCWGQCCWIGGGWCLDSDPRRPALKTQGVNKQIPDLAGDGGASGRGVVASAGFNKVPLLNNFDKSGTGVVGPIGGKRPRLSSFDTHPGTGVVGPSPSKKRPLLGVGNSAYLPGVCGESKGRPQLGDEFDIGRGVNANRNVGTCVDRRRWLREWMERLADRLRLVRICYGNWNRICDSPTTMTRLGSCGAFVDPPYAKDLERMRAWIAHLLGDGPAPPPSRRSSNRASNLYANDGVQDVDRLVAEVHLWCRKWGAEKNVRIALCGYEGEHDFLEQLGWTVHAWKAHGGYSNRNPANQNKTRERIWFSPYCLTKRGEQLGLFV